MRGLRKFMNDKANSVTKFIEELNDGKDMWCGFDGECFANNVFSVDKTPLCRIDGDTLYISATSITPKCALYIRELTLQASKLASKIIYIPQWHTCDKRCHSFSREEIIQAFKDEFETLKDKSDIYSKSHLENMLSTMNYINENCFPIPKTLINDTAKVLKKIDKAVKIEDKKVKEFINTHTYYEIAEKAYFTPGVDIKFMTALRKYLNPSGEYAFLNYNPVDDKWYSSEKLCGLPKATMCGEDGLQIARLYHTNQIKHGMKFGDFTVMKVMDSYIQISCNRYTRAMIESCYDKFILNKKSEVANT